MRSFIAISALCAAVALGASAWAQPPAYEVRTYVDEPLTNFDPGAPAATTENTLKEPWMCPYCGFSTGGTLDVLDVAPADGNPDGDADGNGIPDEAEGICLDPWGLANHPNNLALAPADIVERFLQVQWLGPVAAPVWTLMRGVPFRPGDIDPSVIGPPTNTGSRVRVAFAFDPNNPGLPGFQLGAQPTQVRFLLIPPGVARPSARYHSLTWEPGGAQGAGTPIGAGYWGVDPSFAIQNGDLRIGVHPWRAIDGDVYHVRCRANPTNTDVDIEAWSEANGLELLGTFDAALGLRQGYCASGAVRIDIPADLMLWQDFSGTGVGFNWWAFRFQICNNSRIMPNTGDDGVPPIDPNWLATPQAPAMGSMGPNPQNHFVAQPIVGAASPRGGVFDTDPVGDPVVGTPLSDATAVEFRVRPGETGTGMVAAIWRNDAGDMWSYDEDNPPSPAADTPEPPHANGIQPVAARFFSTRLDTANVVVDIPEGAPGGHTDVGATAANTDLEIQNRQVGEIVRCPVHVPNDVGRAMPPPNDPFVDPWWAGNGTNGQVVGRGPGGDPPVNYAGDPLRPTRTLGCGAVHVIDPASACWCGRTHNPGTIETLYCNYCGTRLLGTGPNVEDVERAEARVDIDAPLAAASHQAAPDPVRPDAVYSLAAESVRGTKDGIIAPGATPVPGGNPATLYTVTSPLFVDIPRFQLPSFAADAGPPHMNGTPQPYMGLFVAYRRADEDREWYEDRMTGWHELHPAPNSTFPNEPILDRSGGWDTFYRCPDCGNKHRRMALAPGGGALAYMYTDEWSAAAWADELECSYGRGVGGAAANNTASECPGHQLCPTCGVAWEAQGEGKGLELNLITLTVCPFDGTPLVDAQTQQTRFIPDYLTAEEFDPFVVQANVTRKTRLAATEKTVDLGRVAPGLTDPIGFPAEVSAPSLARGSNEGNYTVGGPTLLTQGVLAANPTAPAPQAITTAILETLALIRSDVDPAPENRSAHRVARSMPVTGERLFASIPTDAPWAANWGTEFAPRYRGGAGGHAADGVMQAGTWGDPADPADDLPVPNAVGSGNYSGTAIAFVDTNGDGLLSFLDRSAGLAPETSATAPFDPTEDYPLEPVVPVNLRLRVVESPLPQNDDYASDAAPAPLLLDTDGDGLHDMLDLVWESNRVGGVPAPDAAVNIIESATIGAGGPGVARDLPWSGLAQPVTADVQPGTVNGSPEVYLNRPGGQRWALWHKRTPTATAVGASSTLWSAFAPANFSQTFGAAGTANYIFDSSVDKRFIRGFIDPVASSPANHWSFWNSGRPGHEGIHYCPIYDPRDPNTVSDLILPVSNQVAGSAKRDWVDFGGTWIRKPSKSPFTYAKDPAPLMEMDPITSAWRLHVFFSGYVPQDRNPDICYARFDMGDLPDPDLNYGKVPHGRIDGVLGGEELRGDGVRQTFGARHLDWVTTRRPPRAAGLPDLTDMPLAGLDPAIYIHLVFPGLAGANHEVYGVRWTGGRYRRSKGLYQLGGLSFKRIVGSAFAPGIDPVEPRTGRPMEMYIDPAAGMVRFSCPLFNTADSSDPATFFNRGDFPDLDDVQVWANYTPYIYRLCRTDANDDSPSAFIDYADPDPSVPSPAVDRVGNPTPEARGSVGRFVVFWRRSHGASEAPHFGRTSFMCKTYSSAIQVGHPPISSIDLDNGVIDVTLPARPTIQGLGVDAGGGIVGVSPTVGGRRADGHRVMVAYDSAPAGAGRVEYHTIPGWSDEKRVNVDSVYSEGPLVVKKEWYAVPMTDAGANSATEFLSRYWLFWTSPRAWYRYDPATTTGEFLRSRDVYYATVVPEFGTSVTERDLASR